MSSAKTKVLGMFAGALCFFGSYFTEPAYPKIGNEVQVQKARVEETYRQLAREKDDAIVKRVEKAPAEKRSDLVSFSIVGNYLSRNESNQYIKELEKLRVMEEGESALFGDYHWKKTLNSALWIGGAALALGSFYSFLDRNKKFKPETKKRTFFRRAAYAGIVLGALGHSISDFYKPKEPAYVQAVQNTEINLTHLREAILNARTEIHRRESPHCIEHKKITGIPCKQMTELEIKEENLRNDFLRFGTSDRAQEFERQKKGVYYPKVLLDELVLGYGCAGLAIGSGIVSYLARRKEEKPVGEEKTGDEDDIRKLKNGGNLNGIN